MQKQRSIVDNLDIQPEDMAGADAHPSEDIYSTSGEESKQPELPELVGFKDEKEIRALSIGDIFYKRNSEYRDEGTGYSDVKYMKCIIVGVFYKGNSYSSTWTKQIDIEGDLRKHIQYLQSPKFISGGWSNKIEKEYELMNDIIEDLKLRTEYRKYLKPV